MFKFRPASLVLRLCLGYIATMQTIVTMCMGLAYWSLVRSMEMEDRELLLHTARVTVQRIEHGDSRPYEETGALVRLLGRDGTTRAESPAMAVLVPKSFIPVDLKPWTPIDGTSPRGSFLALMVPVRDGVLQVAQESTQDAILLRHHRLHLLQILTGATGLVALLGWVFTRRGLRPIQALAETTAQIRPENLETRVDTTGLPVELAGLARALNGALERLEEAFGRLTSLASDLAHELRTPLHGLKLDLESLVTQTQTPELMREPLGRLLDKLNGFQRLVDQLIFLARTEDPSTVLEMASIPLRVVLESAISPFESWAEEGQISIGWSAPAELHVLADPTLLGRALHNLIANALRHTRPGGRVELRGFETGSSVIIEVSDTGEGIPASHLTHIGKRFHRTDPSRSRVSGGMGLGLAIVNGIAKLHRGNFEMHSEEGLGTAVRLTFPKTGLHF